MPKEDAFFIKQTSCDLGQVGVDRQSPLVENAFSFWRAVDVFDVLLVRENSLVWRQLCVRCKILHDCVVLSHLVG